jgi:pyruvate kinase
MIFELISKHCQVNPDSQNDQLRFFNLRQLIALMKRLHGEPPANDLNAIRIKRLSRLRDEMDALNDEIIRAAATRQAALAEVDPGSRRCALNLLHYLAFRRRDRRGLQGRLARLGLSSLGRAEPDVLTSIEAVRAVMYSLAGPPDGASPLRAPGATRRVGRLEDREGSSLLAERAERLLGPVAARTTRAGQRPVSIMVTLPTEAADDPGLIPGLMQAGMNCARINCAHDDPAVWAKMIARIRQSAQELGRTCRIAMDLAGPKLRTGAIEPGPAVLKIRPHRDAFGKVLAAACVRLYEHGSMHSPPGQTDHCLPLVGYTLAELKAGDRLEFVDARGARRHLDVLQICSDGAWAQIHRTAYLVEGIVLKHGRSRAARWVVGALEPKTPAIELRTGDLLSLVRAPRLGHAARFDSQGKLIEPACIGCTLFEAFDHARVGESIWFDDGRIGGLIESISSSAVEVRIDRTPAQGARLRADKGINLPQTDVRLDALTDQDRIDLEFVAHHADIVQLSFVSRPEDVVALQSTLRQIVCADDAQLPAIVVKIETRRGFSSLPQILLAALREPTCGVMIARGDLAVECGFERLAEVQEEILWLCEAAHVPVIWATQVLESLAETGLPSRAEITDAAMGNRAECVMLNKGPHMVETVRMLADILTRMAGHQAKKRALLRGLRVASA